MYDLTFAGRDSSEYDRFLEREDVLSHEDFPEILTTAEGLLNDINYDRSRQFPIEKFRHEFLKHGYALPYHYEVSGLRLYYIRWNWRTLIRLDGGIKTVKGAWQDDPNLEPIVTPYLRIEKSITEAIRLSNIREDNLEGGFFAGKRSTPAQTIELY
jgi:hypothetical protein